MAATRSLPRVACKADERGRSKRSPVARESVSAPPRPPELTEPEDRDGGGDARAAEKAREELRAGRLEGCLRMLEALKMEGYARVGDFISHKAFLREASDKGEVAMAMRFVSTLHPFERGVRVYNLLLTTCSRNGNVQAASRVEAEMKARGMPLDERVHNNLISAHAKAGDVEGAFRRFQAMLEEGEVAPTGATFTALLDSLSLDIRRLVLTGCPSDCVLSRLEACEAVWQTMQNYGVEADGHAISCLIAAYCRAAEIDNEALSTALALYARMGSSYRSRERPVQALAPILHAMVSVGQPARALIAYRLELKRRGAQPSQATSAALAACARLCRGDEAIDIYKHAGAGQGSLCGAALEAVARQGGTQVAAREREHLEAEGDLGATQEEAYGALMVAMAKSGDAEGASRLFSECKSRNGRVPTQAIAAFIALEGRGWGAAGVRLAKAAEDEIRNGVAPLNQSIAGALIARACDREDPDGAMSEYRRARSANIQPQALAAPRLLALLGRNTRAEELEEVLADLWRQNLRSSLLCKNAELALAVARGDDDMIEKASQDLPPDGTRADSCTALLVLAGRAKAGKAKEVREEFLRELKSDGLQMVAGHFEIGAWSLFREAMDAHGASDLEQIREEVLECFHEMRRRGVRPSYSCLGFLIGSFRQPGAFSTTRKPKFASPTAVPKFDEPPEENVFYDSRALTMFEEAQSAGMAPRFVLLQQTIWIDAREFPPAMGDVALLSLLRSLRLRRRTRRTPSPLVSIQTNSRSEERSLWSTGKKRGRKGSPEARLARTATKLCDLLCRLGLQYTARAKAGQISITGGHVDDWLSYTSQPFSPLSNTSAQSSNSLADQTAQLRMQSFGSSGPGPS